MNSLRAVTPVGTFTRSTEADYTHVVVRTSEVVTKAVAEGRDRRWAKDLGFAVTWHSSKAAAEKAAAGAYRYDRNAKLVGVFAVEAEGAEVEEAGDDLEAAIARDRALIAERRAKAAGR